MEGDFGGDVLQFTPDAAFRRMQLAYNRDLLLSMVKAMPVSMHLMDSRCEVVMWNDATLALFGYPPDVDRVDVFGELLPALQPDGTPSL
ncbi:MAG: PAS domain-containing protein [Eggerthellaceae bacterium]